MNLNVAQKHIYNIMAEKLGATVDVYGYRTLDFAELTSFPGARRHFSRRASKKGTGNARRLGATFRQ